MNKINTSRVAKKLPDGIARVLRRNSGLCAKISRQAGFRQRSFVSRVVSGEKPPSPRFLKAMTEVLIRESDVLLGAAAGVELAGLLAAAKIAETCEECGAEKIPACLAEAGGAS